MSCLYCNLNMHTLCNNDGYELDEGCCCDGKGFVDNFSATAPTGIIQAKVPAFNSGQFKKGQSGFTNWQKNPEDMKDVLSSGRKRASELLPTNEFGVCNWAGLRYAGGGIYPIIGCDSNKASHRHHGPNKSTLDNRLVDNLHAVCYWCHNRWHVLNDPTYLEPRPAEGADWYPQESVGECKPHDAATLATEEEIKAYAQWWKLDKDIRDKNPFITRLDSTK